MTLFATCGLQESGEPYLIGFLDERTENAEHRFLFSSRGFDSAEGMIVDGNNAADVLVTELL